MRHLEAVLLSGTINQPIKLFHSYNTPKIFQLKYLNPHPENPPTPIQFSNVCDDKL